MIVNLTSRPVTLMGADGNSIVLEPSGTVARVGARATKLHVEDMDGVDIHLVRPDFGQVIDLPEPDGQTKYVVSQDVLSACPGRDDLLVPSRCVRDNTGAMIAFIPPRPVRKH
jgi:hypothetical protein